MDKSELQVPARSLKDLSGCKLFVILQRYWRSNLILKYPTTLYLLYVGVYSTLIKVRYLYTVVL